HPSSSARLELRIDQSLRELVDRAVFDRRQVLSFQASSTPTENLTFGQQLAFYTGRSAPSFDLLTRGRGRSRAGYGRIGEILDESNEESVTVSFAEVEDILGRPLPASARKYPSRARATF
ncbi:MAG: hypothetical protein ACLP41_12405, partial [Acidimicrobiales bacterium]